jgi:hypothetical protein
MHLVVSCLNVRLVPFESFRAEIEAAVLTPVSEKKSSAGRKPIDVMVMFRMLVSQSLYKLSDEQVEYQVRDRLSFARFLGLGIEDKRAASRSVYAACSNSTCVNGSTSMADRVVKVLTPADSYDLLSLDDRRRRRQVTRPSQVPTTCDANS